MLSFPHRTTELRAPSICISSSEQEKQKQEEQFALAQMEANSYRE
jgi:hypothetical protein